MQNKHFIIGYSRIFVRGFSTFATQSVWGLKKIIFLSFAFYSFLVMYEIKEIFYENNFISLLNFTQGLVKLPFSDVLNPIIYGKFENWSVFLKEKNGHFNNWAKNGQCLMFKDWATVLLTLSALNPLSLNLIHLHTYTTR